MRIEFLTQDDPIYVFPFFDEFLRNYSSEFTITQISCCRAMGKRPRVQLLRELTLLYGWAGMARLLGLLAKARVMGRFGHEASGYYDLPQIASAYGILFKKIGNPNAQEFIDSARERHPDVIVSVACPYILRDALLSVPLRGCVNIHHAPLPRYKGMMPTFWQMFHGEKAVGVTVHFMVGKVDEGQVLLQESLEILKDESLHSLILRSKRYGAHCMARVLRQMETHSHVSKSLASAAGSYFTFPTSAEIREFHRRGFRAM